VIKNLNANPKFILNCNMTRAKIKHENVTLEVKNFVGFFKFKEYEDLKTFSDFIC